MKKINFKSILIAGVITLTLSLTSSVLSQNAFFEYEGEYTRMEDNDPCTPCLDYHWDCGPLG